MLQNILNKEDFNLFSHAAEFSRVHLSSPCEERDHQSEFAQDLWNLLLREGYTDLFIPTNLSGSGLNLTSACAVLNGLAQKSSDNGLLFSLAAHLLAVQLPVLRFSAQQPELKLRVSGKNILANAMTEARGGSDAFNMDSTAFLDGNNYKVKASKCWITNAPVADQILLFVSTDKNKGAMGGITAFLVDKTNFLVGEKYSKLGLRTSPASDVFVDAVLSAGDIVNEPGSGLMIFQTAMNAERIGMAAMNLGIMEHLMEEVLSFIRLKKSTGVDLMNFHSVSHLLAEMKIKLDACRLMVYYAAGIFDQEKNVNAIAAELKVLSSESLKFCADAAMTICASGTYQTGWIERTLRDAQASGIYSGTNHIQKNIISAYL